MFRWIRKARNLFLPQVTVSIPVSKEIDMVVKLREQGFTQKQIAKYIGKTQNQVKGILKPLIDTNKVTRKKKYAKRGRVVMEERNDINYRPSKSTKKSTETNWIKKYNVDVEAFKNYYPYHTNEETGKFFGFDRRIASQVAKQLGISKRPHITQRKCNKQVIKKKI